jgi:tRNA(Ile)-lysidine synthase
VLVAVSGGADSTALLLALDELLKSARLDVRLTVAHMNHGLRGERGAEDARWVMEQSRSLGYKVVVGNAALKERAGALRDNLEQAARRARYEFLAWAARETGARAVLAAHTLDDQAETVLLRLLRGSGAEGLGGIRPERVLEGAGGALLLRPLVGWARRADTESFCLAHGVEARADEMNTDESFARVRVRRRLLPLLETFNPRVVETLARTADLLGEDARALEVEAARLLDAACERVKAEAGARDSTQTREDDEVEMETRGEGFDEAGLAEAGVDEAGVDEAGVDEGTAEGAPVRGGAWPLRVAVLEDAPRALRRRALRQWLAIGRGDLRRLESVHVAAVEKLLAGERGGRVVELPGGACVERRRGHLLFVGKKIVKARP